MGEILSISDYKRTQELSGYEEIFAIFKASLREAERVNQKTPYNCVFVNKDGFIRFDKMMGFYERYRIPKQSKEPMFIACGKDDYAKFNPTECYEYRFDHKTSIKDLMVFKEI